MFKKTADFETGGTPNIYLYFHLYPLQAATVAQAAQTPSYALTLAHKRKVDKSWQACHQQGIVFLPHAVESLGAWHKSASAEVKKLGNCLARHTGEDEGTTTPPSHTSSSSSQ